jgi:F-type H+-transporting ATPase subunit delta
MPNPRLASRYAKSLIDLAIERNELDKVFADMQLLHSIIKSNKDFVTLLRSPIIKADKKKKILEAVLDKKITEMTSGFINLLVAKNRESNLPEIITAFISQYKVNKNIHTVQLTTAVPISDSLKNVIVNQVKKSSGYENIEVEEKVDEGIIGGFVLQIGDKLVDASVAYDLREIARQFENNDFIYKIR